MMKKAERMRRLLAAIGVSFLVMVAAMGLAGVAMGSFATSNDAVMESTAAIEDRYVRVYGEGPYDEHDGWGPYYIRYTGNEATVDVARDLESGGGEILGTRVTSTFKLFDDVSDGVEQIMLPDVSFFSSDPDYPLDAMMFGDKGSSHAVDVVYRDRLGRDFALSFSEKSPSVIAYLYLEDRHLSETVSGGRAVRKYVGAVPNIYISREIETLDYLLAGNKATSWVLIDPEGSWKSMTETFSNCANLMLPESFRFPARLETMDHTFFRCLKLVLPSGAKLPSSLRDMPSAFYSCSSLTAIPEGFLNDGVETLSYAFSYCGIRQLPADFKIPASATAVTNMFENCFHLLTVPPHLLDEMTAPNMSYLFYKCENLQLPEGFEVPETVTSMYGTFNGCINIRSLPESFALPPSLENFTNTFFGCKSLVSLPAGFRIPATCKKLDAPFAWCSSLKTLPEGFSIPQGVESIEGFFFGCSGLESLPSSFVVEDGVKNMTNTFKGCTSLSADVEIPRSVTKMNSCFENAGQLAQGIYDADGNVGDGGEEAPYAIVARYHDPGSYPAVLEYARSHGNGKLLMTHAYDWSSWEKVYGDAKAPYDAGDGKGPFYLHYKGGDHAVDVQDALNAKGEILGVAVTSTYRMFEGLDAKVKRVLLPEASIAPVDPSLFGSAGPSSAVEVVYRAQDGADHTGDFAVVPRSDLLTPCLYLTPVHLSNVRGSDQEDHATYQGAVPNVYVSWELESLHGLFCDNKSIEYVSMTGRSRNTWMNLTSMFRNCTSLRRLADDFSIPDTALRLKYYWYGCAALESLPEQLTIPDSATDLHYLLYQCSSIEGLPSEFALSANAKTVEGMFYKCTKLKSLPGSFKIPGSVANANSMFRECKALASLPDGFTITEGVVDASYMFDECTGLTMLPSAFRLPGTLERMEAMFGSCYSLQALPDGFTIPKQVKRLYIAFSSCRSLTRLPDSFSLPEGVLDTTFMFSNCTSLLDLPEGFAIPSSVTDASSMFNGCTSLQRIPENILLQARPKSISSMFRNCSSVPAIPDSFVIPEGVTSVSNLFEGCTLLTGLPSTFALPSTTVYATELFKKCTNLASLPSNFRIPPNVAWVSGMFYECKSLTALPADFALPGSVTSMTYMFYYCDKLTALPEHFAIPGSVTSLDNTFAYCMSLASLPAGFEIPPGVTSLYYAFTRCWDLQGEISVPSSVTNVKGCFDEAGQFAPKNYLADGSHAAEGQAGIYAIVAWYDADASEAVKAYRPGTYSSVKMLQRASVATTAGEAGNTASAASPDTAAPDVTDSVDADQAHDPVSPGEGGADARGEDGGAFGGQDGPACVESPSEVGPQDAGLDGLALNATGMREDLTTVSGGSEPLFLMLPLVGNNRRRAKKGLGE